MVKCRYTRLPTRLDDGRGIFLSDDGWALQNIAWTQVFAHDQGGITPFTIGIDLHRVALRHISQGMQGVHLLC